MWMFLQHFDLEIFPELQQKNHWRRNCLGILIWEIEIHVCYEQLILDLLDLSGLLMTILTTEWAQKRKTWPTKWEQWQTMVISAASHVTGIDLFYIDFEMMNFARMLSDFSFTLSLSTTNIKKFHCFSLLNCRTFGIWINTNKILRHRKTTITKPLGRPDFHDFSGSIRVTNAPSMSSRCGLRVDSFNSRRQMRKPKKILWWKLNWTMEPHRYLYDISYMYTNVYG